MFTGIVEKAKIIAITGGTFMIQDIFGKQLKQGESISHDGACMTLTKIAGKQYTFFAMEETFRRTNFEDKKPGDYFNVERSLKLGSRLDGHFVSGHIDTVGKVTKIIHNKDGSIDMFISYPKTYNRYVVYKGSIAVNGVSLTVVKDAANTFSVSLIPITLEKTNLSLLKVGDKANLEFDILAKYILKSHGVV
ncbi:MAG: riboflavin synthase [candidate division SR1 bacterium CG_4_9_14_3_um_filter_40_9]|nr:MAG: riboflavin synthase [candidate division SR1 bacterium CG_4_9_14_3_um_filter_40_9]